MPENENYACPVSVIMPVFNAEKYVSEAITGILNQTFSNFEFIVIDDGSTDGSRDFIQSFKDDRITVVRNKKNVGQYPSRNMGIRMAKGKYIAVMDADDIALPDRLWKQYDYMENNPAILATGTQVEVMGKKDSEMKRPVSYHDICASLLYNNYFVHSTLFLRSEAIRRTGGYDEQYVYASDYDLVCRLSLAGKVENLKDTCLRYRWHPGQISQAKSFELQGYTDIIRQKYQIAFINKHRSPELPEVGESETGHPDMGRVIGLYVMGQRFSPSYGEQADRLLDCIADSLHTSIPLRIKKGLLGIGSGVMYLLRNNFVSGDEDEILESIDEAVLKSVSNVQNDSGLDWEGTYYYLRKRALPPKTGNFVTRLRMVKALFRLKFRQMTVKRRTFKNGKKFVHIEQIHNNLTIPDSVVPFILDLYPRVQSVVDFGCGLGIWLLSFKNHGVKEILGLDGDWCDKSILFKNIDKSSFRTVDLEKPVCLNREYDLVISLEVAEHLPENAADTFVRSLVSAGKVILFSAAIPGQGGYNHVNEQFPEYWQEKFQKHGYVFHDIVRDKIRNNHNVPFWYRQNMYIVAHENIKFPADAGDTGLN